VFVKKLILQFQNYKKLKSRTVQVHEIKQPILLWPT
jgi:hypothetical protein